MFEFYYTLLMLGSFMGMLLYSRSIPTALLSLYVLYWFLPQGINVIGTNSGVISIIGVAEILYFIYFYTSKLKESCDEPLMSKSIRYVVSMMAFYLLIAFLSTEMPLGEQFDMIKHFIYYSFNIIIAASCLNNKKEFVCIFHFVILLVIISGIYGLYTYTIQYNPFAELVLLTQEQLEDQGLGSEFLEDERGFLQGRISGLTVHPLMYGGVLVLCFFMLMSYSKNVTNKLGRAFFFLFFPFCLVLIVLTGSRSILIGLICGLFYYLFKLHPQKIIKLSLLGIVLIVMFGITIEDEYIRSILFFWKENDEIKGSSTSMRIDQIEAAYDVISENLESFLFGLGRGWTTQYGLKYGNVPPFHGFEGILIFSLVEYGVLGTICYLAALFVPLFNLNSNYVTNSKMKRLINAFLLSGIVIFTFTGHAYGQWLYVVLAFLMIKYGICMEEQDDYDGVEELEEEYENEDVGSECLEIDDIQA